MSIRQIELFLILILVLAGCATINEKKIDKEFKKEKDPVAILSIMKGYYHSEKIDESSKIHIIRKLEKKKNKAINGFFASEYQKENNNRIKKILLEGLISQGNINNCSIFLDEIKAKNSKSDVLIKQIIKFGKDCFPELQIRLTTNDESYRKELVKIVTNLDKSVLNKIILQYISESPQNKGKLLTYLLLDKSKTAEYIAENIIKGKISKFDQIDNIVSQIGKRHLQDYKSLFITKFQSPQGKKVTKKIFLSFANSSILALDLIYPVAANLEKKTIIFEILRQLNSKQSLDSLKRKLNNAKSSFEQEKIVKCITEMTTQFPTEFINLLKDPNISDVILSTIPDYINKDEDSVVEAFTLASDIGKVKILEYSIRNRLNGYLAKIIPEIYFADPYLRIFSIATLAKENYYHHVYEELVEKMLSSENMDEFTVAYNYAAKNSTYFIDFIYEHYDSLINISEKNYYLPYIFTLQDSTKYESFLLKKFIYFYKHDQKNIASVYADSYLKKKNLDTDVITNFLQTIKKKSLYSALAFLLQYNINNSNFNQVITTWLINHYFKFELDNRLKIIKFMADSSNESLAAFLIDKYDALSLLEKGYLNSNIFSLPFYSISDHLEKVVYLGDYQQFKYISDFLTFQYSVENIPDELKYAIASRYFLEMDYQNFQKYSSLQNPQKFTLLSDQKDIIKINSKASAFDKQYQKKFMQKPTNLLMIYKSLCDSIIINTFKLKSPLMISVDKKKIQKLINYYQKQLSTFRTNFYNIFLLYDMEDKFSAENNIQVSISEVTYLKELKCGNITYIAESDSVYLYILVELKNRTSVDEFLNKKDITLSCNKNNYKVNDDGDFYENFKGNKVKDYISLKSKTSIFYPLYFKVNVADSNYTLNFVNNKLFNIVMPIPIKKSYKIK